MLVSYKWLNEYVDLKDVAPKDLADRLSLTGIEVECKRMYTSSRF